MNDNNISCNNYHRRLKIERTILFCSAQKCTFFENECLSKMRGKYHRQYQLGIKKP